MQCNRKISFKQVNTVSVSKILICQWGLRTWAEDGFGHTVSKGIKRHFCHWYTGKFNTGACIVLYFGFLLACTALFLFRSYPISHPELTRLRANCLGWALMPIVLQIRRLSWVFKVKRRTVPARLPLSCWPPREDDKNNNRQCGMLVLWLFFLQSLPKFDHFRPNSCWSIIQIFSSPPQRSIKKPSLASVSASVGSWLPRLLDRCCRSACR